MSNLPARAYLDDVVRQFDKLIGHLGRHGIVSGVELYVQPPVSLSLHTVAMRAAGWEIDYEQVAALSGACAPFGYQPDEFMCKYAYLDLDPDARLAEATGYGFEWVPFASIEEAWSLIKTAVAAGQPVRGWHWEALLFGGYEEADAVSERRGLCDGRRPRDLWSLVALGRIQRMVRSGHRLEGERPGPPHWADRERRSH